jgi:GTP-binding protein YchF
MALKCGIIGVANVGKTTIFNCMSNTKVETTSYAFGSSKSNLSVINVPDSRLNELAKLHPAGKIIQATVEIVDIPGLTKGSNKGEGVGNKFLGDIRNTDSLIHVLRCFDDDKLSHIEGSVDPVRDIETIDFELQLKDLESVEKKMEQVKHAAKSGDKDSIHRVELLSKVKTHLDSFKNIRSLDVDETDKKYIEDLFLLTVKPVMYVCNVNDDAAANGNKYVDQVKEALKGQDAEIIIIAGQLEAEISEFENDRDRLEFLNDAGLSEPGVNRLIRAAYSLLDLISFFTMNRNEIRAWTLKKGSTAQQAAGIVHSDMERGFIRAEVIKYEDFVNLGSEHACREKGKLSVEGKNYKVADGDILHIRFNV